MRVASDGMLPGSARSRCASTYRPRSSTAAAMQSASTDKAMLRMQSPSAIETSDNSGRESDPAAEEDHTDPQRDRQRAAQPRRARGTYLIPFEHVTIGAEVKHRHVHARQEHA